MIRRTFLLTLAAGALFAQQRRPAEYALILHEPPVAELLESSKGPRSAAAAARDRRIAAAQNTLRSAISERGIVVTGTARTLVNAVFVDATREQAEALRGLPGVARVVYQPPFKRHSERALELTRFQTAWNNVGGAANAGQGVRIAVIDTGIDHTHPAFQDATLPMPAGFPRGRPEDQRFTNNKVIVARSYVDRLWLPDDRSPRDRVGHGTAVAMIAAGVRNSGPAGAISGGAPRAYLGNYKVFGSPGVNDGSRSSAVIAALEDAFNDGMDIAVLSIGSPATYGPLDVNQSACGGECDVRAQAVEAAVRRGLTVIVSAGNDGDYGIRFPALNSIHTPGTAPSAITVGATTNAEDYFAAVRAPEGPAAVRDLRAQFGDGPKPSQPLSAPLRDVASLQNDGLACEPLGNDSLTGAIALIQRGNCGFATKVNHAQRAGAVGVVLFNLDNQNGVFPPTGLRETGIPLAMVGNADGRALKSYIAANPGRNVALDPALRAVERRDPNFIADFSSRGPSIGTHALKPELVAPGTGIYTATQNYDANGDMYDSSRYTAVQGTSFSGPIVAGAAALVKQRNRNFTAGQIKSALVNTASQDVTDDDGAAFINDVGAGKLNAGAAVTTTATVVPSTLSFGVIGTATLPSSLRLTLTNTGTATTNFVLSVQGGTRDDNARVTINPSSVSLPAGQTRDIAVVLEGRRPNPGSYEGFVEIRGGAVPLRVPYLYLVGDGIPRNAFPVIGGEFTGMVNQGEWVIAFKVIDRYGVPVSGAPVRFNAVSGGGVIDRGDATTDVLGIAGAEIALGAQIGEQYFTAEVADIKVEFFGEARPRPAIATNGVVNAASFQVGSGLAPGSYVSIAGASLSSATATFRTSELPPSLAGVSVAFETSDGRSFPGRIHFVSPTLVNVQVPWELQGLNQVEMQVNIGLDIFSAFYDVPLNDHAPAAFEFDDAASGRRIAAALASDFSLITPASPARRGDTISIYCNGLGPVDNTPATGEPSPAEPLARTRVLPTVSVGGRPAAVTFSGLTPSAVGLYQINVTIPADAPTGLQPVSIAIGGVNAKSVTLPVQ